MAESFMISVAAGTVLGFLSGLGIGGGSLLLLWLTLVQGVPQETAQKINLMFFLPAAAVAIFFRWKKGKADLQVILPALLAGIAGTVLTGFLADAIDTQILRKPFGILLLVTALREIFYRPRNAR